MPDNEEQQQEWNPIVEARKAWPGLKDQSDASIYQNIIQPDIFRATFPDYAHLNDKTILKNTQRFAPQGFDEQHPIISGIMGAFHQAGEAERSTAQSELASGQQAGRFITGKPSEALTPDEQMRMQLASETNAPPVDQFETKLNPQEEQVFSGWKAKYAPKDSGEDYDLRGAFKAGLTPDPQTGHWPDTFKKPNHPTFSDQSKYAQFGNPGYWVNSKTGKPDPQGDKYVPPPPPKDFDEIPGYKEAVESQALFAQAMAPIAPLLEKQFGVTPALADKVTRMKMEEAAPEFKARAAVGQAVDAVKSVIGKPITSWVGSPTLSQIAEKYLPSPGQTGFWGPTKQLVGMAGRTTAGIGDFMLSPAGIAAATTEALTGGAASPFLLALFGADAAAGALKAGNELRKNPTPANAEQFFSGLAAALAMITPEAIKAAELSDREQALSALRGQKPPLDPSDPRLKALQREAMRQMHPDAAPDPSDLEDVKARTAATRKFTFAYKRGDLDLMKRTLDDWTEKHPPQPIQGQKLLGTGPGEEYQPEPLTPSPEPAAAPQGTPAAQPATQTDITAAEEEFRTLAKKAGESSKLTLQALQMRNLPPDQYMAELSKHIDRLRTLVGGAAGGKKPGKAPVTPPTPPSSEAQPPSSLPEEPSAVPVERRGAPEGRLAFDQWLQDKKGLTRDKLMALPPDQQMDIRGEFAHSGLANLGQPPVSESPSGFTEVGGDVLHVEHDKENGVEAVVRKRPDGAYGVSVRDVDSGNVFETTIYHGLQDALNKAKEIHGAQKVPIGTGVAKLPADLAKSKPGYRLGQKEFLPQFDSDIDRAAYITAKEDPRSKRDADYLKWAMDQTGLSEEEIREYGRSVKARIKELAKVSKPGILTVPAGTLPVAGGRIGATDEGQQGQPRPGTANAEPAQPPVAEERPSLSGPVGKTTQVTVPGEARSYPGQYRVVELDQIQPSHSGLTFQKNPKYPGDLVNERNYENPANQGKVVEWSGADFNPGYHITDNPDAQNGPVMVDSAGAAVGGNGRTMILQRVYSGNPAGAKRYRDMLTEKAPQFGIDPAQIEGMKQPVLVREVQFSSPEERQRAVGDFNKKSTADLSPAERAIADSRRVSRTTLDYVSDLLESAKDDATLADIADTDLLKRLVDDGVITKQEVTGYVDAKGDLTKAAKDRISKLLTGRFFRDPDQFDNTPASIRNKLERMAPSLAKVDGTEWSLSDAIQEAIDLLEEARAHGQTNLEEFLKQSGLFGTHRYSQEGFELATQLRDTGIRAITTAAREYARDAAAALRGENLFGETITREQAFDEAFRVGPHGSEETVLPPYTIQEHRPPKKSEPIVPSGSEPGESTAQILEPPASTEPIPPEGLGMTPSPGASAGVAENYIQNLRDLYEKAQDMDIVDAKWDAILARKVIEGTEDVGQVMADPSVSYWVKDVIRNLMQVPKDEAIAIAKALESALTTRHSEQTTALLNLLGMPNPKVIDVTADSEPQAALPPTTDLEMPGEPPNLPAKTGGPMQVGDRMVAALRDGTKVNVTITKIEADGNVRAEFEKDGKKVSRTFFPAQLTAADRQLNAAPTGTPPPEGMKSWKYELQVHGEGDKWHKNGVAFATKEEAEAAGLDKFSAWMMANDHRVVPSDEEPNYRYVDRELQHIEKPAETAPVPPPAPAGSVNNQITLNAANELTALIQAAKNSIENTPDNAWLEIDRIKKSLGSAHEIFNKLQGVSTEARRALKAALSEADRIVSEFESRTPPPGTPPPPLEEPKKPEEPKAEGDFGSKNKWRTKEQADAARDRLRNKGNTMRTGIDPEMFSDMVDIGGYYFEGGIRKFADWSEWMMDEIGDWVEPHLQAVFDHIRDSFENFENGPRVGEEPPKEPPTTDLALPKSGREKLADAVFEKLVAGESLGHINEFNKMAEAAFGVSRVSGEWDPKDAFDAMEAGVNQYLLRIGPDLMRLPFNEGLPLLRNLMSRLTTQAVRTGEQLQFQQFSTPPTEAYLVAKVANLTPADVVLEPSAGIGGLAVFPKAIGATVYANEISPRRAGLIENAIGVTPSQHDGEVINALLDPSIQPSVVIMNPPFSAGGAKSNVGKNDNQYGFNHVDSALQRLQPGGRLVAILGGGQANEPNGGASLFGGKSGKWFSDIARKYNVRANVRISGKEYSKYGTSFATRVIVIDKDGPTPGRVNGKQKWDSVVQKNVDIIEEAYDALRSVESSRPGSGTALSTGNQPGSPASAGPSQTPAAGGGQVPSVPSGGGGGVPSRPGAGGGGGGGVVRPGGGPTGLPSGPGAGVGARPNNQPAPGVKPGTQPQGTASGQPGKPVSAPGPTGGSENAPDKRGLLGVDSPGNELDIEEAERGAAVEDTGQYVVYQPSIKGPKHPGVIVESKTMATVPMPKITYRPNLPKELIDNGKISVVQLEAAALAGQANETRLPSGARGWILIGDGTGLGKGREVSAILLDNWRRGRRRLLWLSQNGDLVQDAIRDLSGIGADELMRNVVKDKFGRWATNSKSGIRLLGSFDGNSKIQHEGVIFATYAILRNRTREGATREQQIQDWLIGNDEADGGYMAMDEAHNLKNAVVVGRAQASQQGQVLRRLIDHMPNLRGVALSATAATDVVNMGYLERLGEWGAGTSFPGGFNEFMGEIGAHRTAAMELVARELKAKGKYLARTLSYKGIEYDTLRHELNQDQKNIYRTASRAWAEVIERAEHTIATTTNGGSAQRRNFNMALGQDMQRFFSLLLMTMKLPSIIEDANKALADGKAVVVSFINTGDAQQTREKERMQQASENDEEQADYDFGPAKILTDLVLKNYPTQQYVDDIDDSGNPIKRPLANDDGTPVENPRAVAERDALIRKLERELHLPDNPLDLLINSLGGPDAVAEITSRSQRYDRDLDKWVRRGANANVREMNAFQEGKKLVLVASGAGATGFSYHAGLEVANQRKRHHIIWQTGWSADRALQAAPGRTHRSNQAVAPEYSWSVSDLGGEMRFYSTISRRLGSLGALSKGQKGALTGTDLMEKVNFESEEGKAAVRSFYQALMRGEMIPGANELDDALPEADQAKALPAGTRVKWRADKVGAFGREIKSYDYGTLASDVPALDPTQVGGQVRVMDEIQEAPINIDRDQIVPVGPFHFTDQPLSGNDILNQLRVLKRDRSGQMVVPEEDINKSSKLLNRMLALDPEVQNAVYNYFYDIFQATVQQAIEDGTLDTGVKTLPGESAVIKEKRVISKDPATGAATYYYPVDAHVRVQRMTAKEMDADMEKYAIRHSRLTIDKSGNLFLTWEASPTVHANGSSEPASYFKSPGDGRRGRKPDSDLKGRQDLTEWANEKVKQAQKKFDDATSQEKYAYGDAGKERGRVAVQAAQEQLGKAKEIAVDPSGWARKEWQKQHDASPDHIIVPHHLVGGAVLRFWTPIKEASKMADIYVATDKNNGDRIVGVNVPAGEINGLIQRIGGGRSLVDGRQIYNDVMRNGTRFTLEGGIRIQRTRINRNPVVQIVPPNGTVANNLLSLGVKYEKGMQATYYVPETRAVDILNRILQQYPVQQAGGDNPPDLPPGGGEGGGLPAGGGGITPPPAEPPGVTAAPADDEDLVQSDEEEEKPSSKFKIGEAVTYKRPDGGLGKGTFSGYFDSGEARVRVGGNDYAIKEKQFEDAQNEIQETARKFMQGGRGAVLPEQGAPPKSKSWMAVPFKAISAEKIQSNSPTVGSYKGGTSDVYRVKTDAGSMDVFASSEADAFEEAAKLIGENLSYGVDPKRIFNTGDYKPTPEIEKRLKEFMADLPLPGDLPEEGGGTTLAAGIDPFAAYRTLKKAIDALEAIQAEGLTETKFMGLLRDYVYAKQEAHLDSTRYVKNVNKLFPDRTTQEGINIWIEADGDEKTLREWAAKSKGSLKKGYEKALDLSQFEEEFARKEKAYYEDMGKLAQRVGMLDDLIEAYVHHIAKKPNKFIERLIARARGYELKPNPSLTKQRIFGTFFEGEQHGVEYLDKRVGFTHAAYDEAFRSALAAREFIKALVKRRLKAPDGKPLVTAYGYSREIPPTNPEEGDTGAVLMFTDRDPAEAYSNYVPIDNPSLHKWKYVTTDADGRPVYLEGNLGVHPSIAGHMKALLEKSFFRVHHPDWKINAIARAGEGALKVGALAKGTLFGLVNTFHQFRVAIESLPYNEVERLTFNVNPFSPAEIDLDDKDQMELVRHGLMVADRSGMEMFAEGASSSIFGVADKQLQKLKWFKNIPGLSGKYSLGRLEQLYTSYLFGPGGYEARLKMAIAKAVLDINRRKYGRELNADQLYTLSADAAQAGVGMLNYKLLGRHQTIQDVMRLLLLAPDFLESEVRAFGEAIKPRGGAQRDYFVREALMLLLTAMIVNAVFNGGNPRVVDALKGEAVIGKYRLNFRTKLGDIAHLFEDWRGFIRYRLAPTANVALIDLGQYLTKFKEAPEIIKDELQRTTPIALQWMNESQRKIWQSVIEMAGVQSRPERSKLEQAEAELNRKKYAGRAIEPEALERSRSLGKLREGYASGDVSPSELRQMVRDGDISERDRKNIVRESKRDSIQRRFEHTTFDEAAELWKSANDDEKEELFPQMKKKYENHIKNVPGKDRQAARDKWDDILSERYRMTESPSSPLQMTPPPQ